MARRLCLLLGLVGLIILIVWVWRAWHHHAPPLPASIKAGQHGKRHLSEYH